jgi:hypothetical protein
MKAMGLGWAGSRAARFFKAAQGDSHGRPDPTRAPHKAFPYILSWQCILPKHLKRSDSLDLRLLGMAKVLVKMLPQKFRVIIV